MAKEARERWQSAAIIAATFVLGFGVPDLDFALPFGHRSALTHSMLPVLLILLHREGARLAGGLALGIGVHLSADCFPNAMIGYATVKLPGFGSLGAAGSYIWLGANALAALLMGATFVSRALPRAAAVLLFGAIALGSAVYLFTTDGGWPALALFCVAGAGGWRMRRRGRPQ